MYHTIEEAMLDVRADHVFRAVCINKETHNILLSYSPGDLTPGNERGSGGSDPPTSIFITPGNLVSLLTIPLGKEARRSERIPESQRKGADR